MLILNNFNEISRSCFKGNLSLYFELISDYYKLMKLLLIVKYILIFHDLKLTYNFRFSFLFDFLIGVLNFCSLFKSCFIERF